MDIEKLKRTVAQNIYYLRVQNHLTQQELGEKLNYSDKAISKWERAEGIPDAYVLKQLSELFGVSVDYLLSEHSEQDKKVETKVSKKNKNIITNIILIGIVAISVILFVVFAISQGKYYWQIFIYTLPALAIVGLVFNFIWQKGRLRFLYISAILWTVILTAYVATLSENYWLLFIIGVPFEIIIFLSCRIRISISIEQKDMTIIPHKKEKMKKYRQPKMNKVKNKRA